MCVYTSDSTVRKLKRQFWPWSGLAQTVGVSEARQETVSECFMLECTTWKAPGSGFHGTLYHLLHRYNAPLISQIIGWKKELLKSRDPWLLVAEDQMFYYIKIWNMGKEGLNFVALSWISKPIIKSYFRKNLYYFNINIILVKMSF